MSSYCKSVLVLVRILHSHMHPLSHPTMSLTLQYILNSVMDNEKSVALTNVVNHLAILGWILFPSIHTMMDNFSNLHSNTIALLGYDLDNQVGVVDRIRVFIGRITHRVITDMGRMQRSFKLKDTWFAIDIPEQQRAKCEKVRHYSIFLIASLNYHLDMIQLSFNHLRVLFCS